MTEISEKMIAEIASVTQARLEHGKRTQALSTVKSQAFALDHARAQAAVHSELEIGRITQQLDLQGFKSVALTSAAHTREVYIKRPDLGRSLSQDAEQLLGRLAGPFDVALVLGDGLSSIAANLNGPTFVKSLTDALMDLDLTVSPIILAEQARVALGDQIANALKAQIVVVALGERPGLSAADSLGVYVTFDPKSDTQDSERNCISNIREAGLSITDAVDQTTSLIQDMRNQNCSGVALQKTNPRSISG